MKNKKIHPVILSGGSGTRLWPESRLSFPKQFLKINSKYTLIQETLLRIKNKNLFHPPILICNDEHRFLIAEQLRELGIKPKLIILEPIAKNTGPAVAIASFIVKEIEENGKIIILPSDHKINEKNKFQNAIKQSTKICEENKIITFGIEPNEPDTNFGYIKKGKIIDGKNKIFVADKFEEKPSLNKAKEYLKNKKFLWNSGIFFCKAKTMLNEISIYDKKTFTNSINAIKKANKDLDFLRLSKKYFSKTNAKPIDIAVLEKSKEVVLKIFKVGWHDIGSWSSIYNLSKKNKNSFNTKVVKCSSLNKTGIDEIWKIILNFKSLGNKKGWIKKKRSEQLIKWMWDDLQKNLFEKIKDNKKLVSEFNKLQKKVSMNIISPTEASKKILHHYIKNNKS